MKDKFEIWEPNENFARDRYLEKIIADNEGLKIFLRGWRDNKLLKIAFRSYLTFSTANESFRLKTLYEKDFSNGLNFSSDSTYLTWIKEESRGIYDSTEMIHYLICSNDDIIDIISFEQPVLDWVDE